jgi:uncharacterized protein
MQIKFPPEKRALLYNGEVPARDFRSIADGWFRFKRLGDRVLLTNDLGNYLFVSADDFDGLVTGRLPEGHELRQTLASGGFLIPYLDVEGAVQRYRRRNCFVGAPPFLHIVIPTLRCNTSCVYCHAGRAPMSDRSTDMSLRTAKDVVDMIFRTPSRDLSIEFQGGEPLANFEAVKFIIEYAEEMNRAEKRALQFLLVTNLSLMDEKKMKFLLDHDVLMCTSIDGPRDLHDAARRLPGGSSYDRALRWIERIHGEYRKLGRDLDLWHVDALLTTSRESLGRAKEIVDTYVSLGIKTLHVRPLNPMGFATKSWRLHGYSAEEFMDFYREALDYIVELNKRGVEIIERGAALFLARILSDDDPGYVDLRSPCGAGVGQLAYASDGSVYTCDEGRMVARMGDDVFRIGEARSMTYDDILENETVRSIGIASLLDALPGCRRCVYQPYCGVCPVYNYVCQGSIFGQQPTNDRCRINRWTLDHLFTLLDRDGEAVKKIFERWIIQKPRIKNVAGGA